MEKITGTQFQRPPLISAVKRQLRVRRVYKTELLEFDTEKNLGMVHCCLLWASYVIMCFVGIFSTFNVIGRLFTDMTVFRCVLGELWGRHLHQDHVCAPGSVPGHRRTDAGAEEGALRWVVSVFCHLLQWKKAWKVICNVSPCCHSQGILICIINKSHHIQVFRESRTRL